MAKARGFTLVELLVVILIMGVLLAVVRPMLSSSAARTRVVQCEANLRHVSVAMQAYVQDHDAFPRGLAVLDSVLQDEDLLVCPSTSRRYFYRNPGPDAERDAVVAACVDPEKSRGQSPHLHRSCYLTLTAGGRVQKHTVR